MKERPILFNGEMVRALLGGRKTQTRRIVKPQPTLPVSHFRCVGHEVATGRGDWQACDKSGNPVHAFPGIPGCVTEIAKCPYGQPGDRLWVREAHAIVPRTAYAQSAGVDQVLKPGDDHDAAVFREGWERCKPGRWRPSIHMPRWASRILLEVTTVHVERLQDISPNDCIEEGVWRVEDKEIGRGIEAVNAYRAAWEAINGHDSWVANPWVWVIEFKRINTPQEAA